ncbi:MAG: class I SAM-dependent methyltransferase [Gemmatimonadota bacterium]
MNQPPVANGPPDPRNEMLRINQAQRSYYEQATGRAVSRANSFATNAWRKITARTFGALKAVNLAEEVERLHIGWLGPGIRDKVMELGVGDGTSISPYLATHSRDYLAIDLSQARLDRFRERLDPVGAGPLRVRAVDVLSPEFSETGFDLIYARAVLHHFQYPATILRVLAEKLVPGGLLITYDPLQTWWPARLIRAAYRPFQTDRAWEHPFTKSVLQAIGSEFEIVAVQGFFGMSKWAMLPGIVSSRAGDRLAERWHQRDLAEATSLKAIESCLHASFCLRRRANPASR